MITTPGQWIGEMSGYHRARPGFGGLGTRAPGYRGMTATLARVRATVAPPAHGGEWVAAHNARAHMGAVGHHINASPSARPMAAHVGGSFEAMNTRMRQRMDDIRAFVRGDGEPPQRRRYRS